MKIMIGLEFSGQFRVRYPGEQKQEDMCMEYTKNPDLRHRLGQNGKAAVIEQFAPKTMVDTIESVYQISIEQP